MRILIFTLLLAVLASLSLHRQIPVEPERSESPEARFEWESAKRLPAGSEDVNPSWIARAEKARIKLIESDAGDSGTRAKRTAAWTWLGPKQLAGRTRALVIEPKEPFRMYAGAASGGVFKSLDAGATWQFSGAGLTHLSIGALAMQPKNSNVLLAGTGELYRNTEHPYSAMRGGGVYQSSDGGSNWTPWLTTQNANFTYVSDVVISPNNPKQVFIASNSGIWRTQDGGITLQQILRPATGELLRYEGCTELELRTEAGREILMASCSSRSVADRYYLAGTLLSPLCLGPCPSAIFLSADAGAAQVTFEMVLSEAGMGRTSIAAAPSKPLTLYALSASIADGPDRDGDNVGDYNNGLHALFRSDDGGRSWRATLRNSSTDLLSTYLLHNLTGPYDLACNFGNGRNFFLTAGWYDQAIAVDPRDAERVWVGGVDLFRSDDGGVSFGVASYHWRNDGSYIHPDHHVLKFHPDFDGIFNQSLFIGHDGGVGATPFSRSPVTRGLTAACGPTVETTYFRNVEGLGSSQFYHGSVSSDGRKVLAGAQDNGTWLTEIGSRFVFGGDGAYSAIDPRDANRLYVSYQFGNLFRAEDGAARGQASFQRITQGITDRGLFITPIELDRANPDLIWYGTTRLWRSTNRGTSWQIASPQFGSAFDDQINAIATHANAPGIVVLGTGNAIYRSSIAYTSNGTSVWTKTTPRAGWVSSLSFAPSDARVVYATYSTFGGAHVWRSTDAGESFSAADGDLPDIPVHSIAVHPTDPQKLFVGTDLGLFVSVDGGTHWTAEQTGFDSAIVEKLAINTVAPHFLHAFTYGRGIWRAALSDIDARPISRADPQLTAHWWNPSQSGQGLHMEVLEGEAQSRLLIAWYTYKDGAPIWYYGVGALNGSTASVLLESFSGADFPPRFIASQVQRQALGNVNVRFLSPDAAEFNYPGGTLMLEPLVRPDLSAARNSSGLNACHNGNWYNPQQPGHGLSVLLHPRTSGSEAFLTWYVFLGGAPIYLVGNGGVTGNSVTVDAYRTEGAQFGAAFRSTDVRATKLGTMRLTISGVNSATLDWQFDDVRFGNGTLALTRLSQAAGLGCD